MSAFTRSEIEYLENSLLGRLATVGHDGTPHVAPVGFRYNAALSTIDIGGWNLEKSKKFRDVARTGRAALVADDLASTEPWRPRGVEVRGAAETIEGVQPLIRLHPERIVAWGIDTGGFSRNSRSVAAIPLRQAKGETG
jgi:pyridoxamine 5'-phosphate oxidase family protein